MRIVNRAIDAPVLLPGKRRPSGIARIDVGKPNEGVVDLQMWWVILNDNFWEMGEADNCTIYWSGERIHSLGSRPALGCHVVFDAHQTHFITAVAAGDTRSGIERLPSITLTKGQRYRVPLGLAATNTDGTGSFQRQAIGESTGVSVGAKLLDKGQGSEIRWTWAQPQQGTNNVAAIRAAVPAGSSLLVHTHQMLISFTPPAFSIWDRLWNWRTPPPQPWTDKRQVYLLIQPTWQQSTAPPATGR